MNLEPRGSMASEFAGGVVMGAGFLSPEAKGTKWDAIGAVDSFMVWIQSAESLTAPNGCQFCLGRFCC